MFASTGALTVRSLNEGSQLKMLTIGAAVVRTLAFALMVVVVSGPAQAFDAFGQVGVDDHSRTSSHLESDSLQGDRGRIAIEAFATLHAESVPGMTIRWHAPAEPVCHFAQFQTTSPQELTIAGRVLREIVPELSDEIELDIYLVPMLVRFKHSMDFDVRDKPLRLAFGMAVPCKSTTIHADILSVLVHEFAHVSSWHLKWPNRMSNEFYAHTVQNAAWASMRGQQPGFATQPFKLPKEPRQSPAWPQRFKNVWSKSGRAGYLAQAAMLDIFGPGPLDEMQEPFTEELWRYTRCVLRERPDVSRENPAATWLATAGEHCSGKRRG